jgi:hypothetical protein
MTGYGFAASFDDARAHKEMLFAELGIFHTVGVGGEAAS